MHLPIDSTVSADRITTAERERIRAHYARAVPWLEKHFGGTPLIAVSFPDGWAGDPVYHETFAHTPASVETVAARTSSGTHRFVALRASNVDWLCAAHGTIELDSWSPTLDDPQRAAFARLVLSPHGSVSEDGVFASARGLAERLAAEGLRAIPVLDGFRGVVLWIPFSDGPTYDGLAAWLRGFAAEAAMREPATFTVANLRAERGDRIYLGTKSNHPGMGTLLPYALRGTPQLEVSLPVPFDDLGKIRNGEVTAEGFAEYISLFGDVFALERSRIGAQMFGSRAPQHTGLSFVSTPLELAASDETPRNYIIAAALAVLADGKAHDADDILAAGLARGLLPQSTTRKYVYTALHEYVVRTLGSGRIPAIVQVDGVAATFRLNEPADAWPQIALPPMPRWLTDATIEDLIGRLRTTGTGGDPTAFEIAACDAFAALGFLATHVGGNGAPDGVLVAPLGRAGYRVVLECKTASPGGIVANPRPEEAAKFRDGAGATKSILLGPAFGGDASLDDELRVHGVALWTIDDLAGVLEAQIAPDEMRPMLEAGRADAARRALLWERDHGRRKRIAVIADRMTRAAWRTQVTLAGSVALADTPTLAEDTLLVLADEALAAEGVVAGATLDEARSAIALLVASGTIRNEGAGFIISRPC
jgi:DNA primase